MERVLQSLAAKNAPAKARRRLPRAILIAVVLLGPLTTIGVAWASAAWVPLENGPGTVAWDGDHLQPWLIRLERVTDRSICRKLAET